jgi:Ca2+-binding RTX toxin-like protein
MRHLPLMVTGLLAATLLTTPAASAAGETCQGRPATVVGTPGQLGLTGTEGADVIVTNGARSTDALGGADLVCITGGQVFGDVRVDAGAGDDVVDASAVVGAVDVQLGAGSDTYTGSAHDEDVAGGTLSVDYDTVDIERDVITTGAGGDDYVRSGSEPTVPNSDVVALGADDGAGFGSTLVWDGPMGAGAGLDGGGGGQLAFDSGPGTVVVDAVTGTRTEDGVVTLRWTGFDRFRTGSKATPAPARFEFVGSDRDEELEIVFARAHQGRQRLDMGGGADTLLLGDENLGARGSRYLGGSGEDHVALWAGKKLDLDLLRERIKTTRAGSTSRSTFAGFETQLVGAKRLVLKGTDQGDDLRFYACRATVRGRGGKDDIRQSRGDDYFEGGLRCGKAGFRLYGGRGRDTLQGGRRNDLLVGGPGRDEAFGNAGRDRCSAEKVRSCEIKRR